MLLKLGKELRDQLKNIIVFGAGYVGFSIAVFLSRYYNVCVFEVDEVKIKVINDGMSPIEDADIKKYVHTSVESGRLRAKKFDAEDLSTSDLIILALPTNFDHCTGKFDTNQLDSVLSLIASYDKEKTVIIKSTIPIGYTNSASSNMGLLNCFYSPEFLREGKALYDNFHPSRIVVGGATGPAVEYAELMRRASHERNAKVICTDNTSAELIKLASNAYLAMRIAFFNEIDSFALASKIDIEGVISGMCADPRIGEGYNNPSFSYGGYCLPKDTLQLSRNFEEINVQSPLVSSIHSSNGSRLSFIINEIIKKESKHIGIYRLQMKQGSDNLREASNYYILKELLKVHGLKISLYEPSIGIPQEFTEFVIKDFERFADTSDLIVANRGASQLFPYREKVFTRDIYNEN